MTDDLATVTEDDVGGVLELAPVTPVRPVSGDSTELLLFRFVPNIPINVNLQNFKHANQPSVVMQIAV